MAKLFFTFTQFWFPGSSRHKGKYFSFSTHGQNFQISLHLHENWLTDQMDSADFKYEVKNSVKCNDVTSLLAEAALLTFCHDFFIRSCN